jgi:hypothetical protein
MKDEKGDRRSITDGQLRVLQIVVLALAAGCGAFGLIAILLRLGQDWSNGFSVLTLVALAFGMMAIFFRLFVPSLMAAQGRKFILRQLPESGLETVGKNRDPLGTPDADVAGQLFGLLTTRTIIACALLEGAIFFLLIVTMVEHSLPAVAMAALLWLLLIAHFPTRDWAERWIENQWRLLREERDLSRR